MTDPDKEDADDLNEAKKPPHVWRGYFREDNAAPEQEGENEALLALERLEESRTFRDKPNNYIEDKQRLDIDEQTISDNRKYREFNLSELSHYIDEYGSIPGAEGGILARELCGAMQHNPAVIRTAAQRLISSGSIEKTKQKQPIQESERSIAEKIAPYEGTRIRCLNSVCAAASRYATTAGANGDELAHTLRKVMNQQPIMQSDFLRHLGRFTQQGKSRG